MSLLPSWRGLFVFDDMNRGPAVNCSRLNKRQTESDPTEHPAVGFLLAAETKQT